TLHLLDELGHLALDDHLDATVGIVGVGDTRERPRERLEAGHGARRASLIEHVFDAAHLHWIDEHPGAAPAYERLLEVCDLLELIGADRLVAQRGLPLE